jgi:HD-like signal output (HDOD) protein
MKENAIVNAPLDLNQLLAGAQLPALPQSAIRLLELSKDPDNGPAEFAVPIESDPGLTGQVLRFVNSSYFGFSREISSVKLAITLVGVRTIKNFALWSAVFSLMPNPKCGPFDLKHLWQDSLRRGLFARAMAKLLGVKDAEAPFAAALLQDLAVPLLAKELTRRYEQVLNNRVSGQRLSDLERAEFGWTHADAGAVIARKWNLPEEFAQLIEHHIDLEELLADPTSEPSQLAVALSSLLPVSSDEHWSDLHKFEVAYTKLQAAGSPSIAELLGQIDEQFAEFAPVLAIAVPARSLVDCYQEAITVAS